MAEMKIVNLNEEMVLENMGYLIEIDKTILDDPWAFDNFLMDLPHKWEFSLAVLENERIIGFLICSVKESNIHVHRIAVSPEHHGNKTGCALMNHLLADCYKSGIKGVTLKVQNFNIKAQKFYEKLGFKKDGIESTRYLYKKEI
jgi:ribosomal-protein-alanine N-acetyltransferase